MRKRITAGLSILAACAATAVTLIVTSSPAGAATALPGHVFAPYFEAYNGDNPYTLSQQSGAKFLTLAFFQTEKKGSCTVYWNGATGQPVSPGTYGSQIEQIQNAGGNAIPSFGGYSADHDGTDIADSCTSVSKIAATYEKVISTYDVPRIDLDVEDNSLNDSAAITRRNQAIAQVEQWATDNGRSLQVSYTLPSSSSGLEGSGQAVVQNAIDHEARVDVVNMMTFDFYDGATHNMLNDAESAGTGLVDQLHSLYPSKSTAQRWAMVGITQMIGIDDYGPPETFETSQAEPLQTWATSNGVNTLSFWALQRDNGSCPGTGGSDSCSGVSQSTWQFSYALEPFTH